MDKIKIMVERLLLSKYFDRDTITADELKIKINYIKRLNRQLNRKNYYNRPDANISILNYYFQIKVNDLMLAYFKFKIDYNTLSDELDYLNDCFNEIEKGLQK